MWEINKKSKLNETENKALPNSVTWRPYLATTHREDGMAGQSALPPTQITIWTTCQIGAHFLGNHYSAVVHQSRND